MSSTWPCVSSPATPPGSQNTLVAPRKSRTVASKSSRPRPGCAPASRVEIALCRRQQRAAPFTSMPPPSSTKSRPPHLAWNNCLPIRLAAISGTRRSRCQSGYFAQALKWKWTIAFRCRVGQTPAAVAGPAAVRGVTYEFDAGRISPGARQVSSRQALLASSGQASERFHRERSGAPFGVHPANGVELVRPIGRIVRHASQVASCVSHSAGIEKRFGPGICHNRISTMAKKETKPAATAKTFGDAGLAAKTKCPSRDKFLSGPAFCRRTSPAKRSSRTSSTGPFSHTLGAS